MAKTIHIARDALVSLFSHKEPASATIISTTVAIALLSAVIAIGQGTRERIMDHVQVHNLDMIMVRSGSEAQIFAPQADYARPSLTYGDARAIEDEIPNLTAVSAVQAKRGIYLEYEGHSMLTRVFGVDANWANIRRRVVLEGSFITEADIVSVARVAVLGDQVARTLFPDGGAVGKVIRVENDSYLVKGVLAEIGETVNGGEDPDDRLIVPYTSSSQRLLNRPHVAQIVMTVPLLERIPETAERVRQLLRSRHAIGPSEPDDFFVREPADVVDAALNPPTGPLVILLTCSLMSVVAGGFMLRDMMLAVVTRSSSEIALRRATGSRPSEISRLFLLEAVFVALGGGVLGVTLGLTAAMALDSIGLAASRITWLPFGAALAASVAIGFAFGIQPAKKAAHIDPLGALRGRSIQRNGQWPT